MKRVSLLAFLFTALLAGCDLFSGEEDGSIIVTGTVVLESTGAPIEGLSVALDEIQGIGHHYTRTVQTDAAGRFTLRHEALKGFGYRVVVNANPISSDYTGRGFRVSAGESRDLGVIELEERDGG